MNSKRRKELEAKGWKFGGVEDFLGLTDEELEYIELKITLSEMVKEHREKRGLSQVNAAKILKSSQSRLTPFGRARFCMFEKRLTRRRGRKEEIFLLLSLRRRKQ